jgi:hypothetical protein
MAEKAHLNSKTIIIVILAVIWLGVNLKDLYDMSRGRTQARFVAQTFQLSYTGDTDQLVAFVGGKMKAYPINENISSQPREILITLTATEKFLTGKKSKIGSSSSSGFSSGWGIGNCSHSKGKLLTAGNGKLVEYTYEAYMLPPDIPISVIAGGAEIKSEVTFLIYDNMLTLIARRLGLGCIFTKEIQFAINKKDLPVIMAMLHCQQ